MPGDTQAKETGGGFEQESPRRHFWNWAAVAAAILLVVFFSWRVIPELVGRRGMELLTRDVVASHIRSLQPGHLLDIESADLDTVKPWFNGKIDFSPPVKDFSEDGFSLIGGRLDYIDERPAAALVYQRHKHLINVYVWPAAEKNERGARLESRQGYNLVFWQSGGMYFCAVSDLTSGELQQLAQLFRK
jgi:anti-sigma factor RsiW